MEFGRASYSGKWVRIDLDGPQGLPSQGIQGVDIGSEVAKIGRVLWGITIGQARNTNSTAYTRRNFYRPIDTASGCIKRIHLSAHSRNKNTATNHRWLRGNRVRGKTKGPF